MKLDAFFLKVYIDQGGMLPTKFLSLIQCGVPVWDSFGLGSLRFQRAARLRESMKGSSNQYSKVVVNFGHRSHAEEDGVLAV